MEDCPTAAKSIYINHSKSKFRNILPRKAPQRAFDSCSVRNPAWLSGIPFRLIERERAGPLFDGFRGKQRGTDPDLPGKEGHEWTVNIDFLWFPMLSCVVSCVVSSPKLVT